MVSCHHGVFACIDKNVILSRVRIDFQGINVIRGIDTSQNSINDQGVCDCDCIIDWDCVIYGNSGRVIYRYKFFYISLIGKNTCNIISITN